MSSTRGSFPAPTPHCGILQQVAPWHFTEPDRILVLSNRRETCFAAMAMAPRQTAPRFWSIACHAHTDNLVTARVHVEGRLLLPSCEGKSPVDALRYLEAVLVDCREQDRFALRIQGAPGVEWNLRAASPNAVLSWFRKELTARCTSPRASEDTTADEAAHSGTQPIEKDSELAAKLQPCA